MKFFTRILGLILTCSTITLYTPAAQAADIYTVSCPKCDYKVRLRSGGTKMSHDDPPSVYFCIGEKKLISIRSSLVKDGRTQSYYCKSKLIPFNPLLKNQNCPVCGGKIVISEHAIAC